MHHGKIKRVNTELWKFTTDIVSQHSELLNHRSQARKSSEAKFSKTVRIMATDHNILLRIHLEPSITEPSDGWRLDWPRRYIMYCQIGFSINKNTILKSRLYTLSQRNHRWPSNLGRRWQWHLNMFSSLILLHRPEIFIVQKTTKRVVLRCYRPERPIPRAPASCGLQVQQWMQVHTGTRNWNDPR